VVGKMAKPKKAANLETYSGRLAHRIRTLRERAGLDVERFSVTVTQAGYKVAVPTIYHWENGTNQPSLDALPYIAAALGVSVRTLLPKE